MVGQGVKVLKGVTADTYFNIFHVTEFKQF